MKTANEVNAEMFGVLLDLVDRYGEEVKTDRPIEGTDAVDFLSQYLLPEVSKVLRALAKIKVEDCPWCREDSWYGDEHLSYCPISIAKSRL